jgi:8-oxo-dGTP pyrophosphatase MutT (NUDIX family)
VLDSSLAITRDDLKAALAAPLPLPARGTLIDTRAAKAAAVVVPVVFGAEPSVFVVLRSAHLKDHAAEVGFPGGKPEPADPDLASTALRELSEEVGISAADIELVGTLVPIPVITGRYLIHPYVGVLRDDAPTPRVASPEIARILRMPLLPLLTGAAPIRAVRGEWGGDAVFAPHFALDGGVLYGASAYILYELLARLAATLGRVLPEPHLQDELPWGDRYRRPS